MSSINKEALTGRIRKLLALSESPNQHEAEAAMNKVNKLLTEHQIEMSEVLVAEIKGATAHKGEKIKTSETYRSFRGTLAQACSELFDTGTIEQRHLNAVYFVGAKEDVILAENMFNYLFDSWLSIVKHDCKVWKKEMCNEYCPLTISQYEIKKYKIGHGQGFSETLWYRAHELAKERKVEVKATGTNLIVLKDQLVKDWVGENCSGTVRGTKRQFTGRSDGRIAGENIPLAGAIDQGKKQLI